MGEMAMRPHESKRWQVLPRPRPLYPSNSLAWVRLMRAKNLVAVGRDELYADHGWFERYRFPAPDLLEELLDVFFHHLMPLMPIVHGPTLRRDLAQGRAKQDSAFRGLIFTILAIAARFLPADDVRVLADPDDKSTAGDHWAAASRLYHQVFAASLINVQVLLLTATFMPASLGVGTSWTVLGVAIRALQDIGLHTEMAYSEYSPFEREMRRRVFWGTLILDGILSVNLGRPTALRMADCHVHLPLLASEEALMRAEETGGPVEVASEEDMRSPLVNGIVVAGFIHMGRVNMLVQDIVTTLYPVTRLQPDMSHMRPPRPSYRDMTELAKRLDDWVEGIPPHLQDIRTSPFPLQAGIVALARHDIHLYIHKPFLHVDNTSKSSSHSAATTGAPSHSESVLKKMLLPTCASHARKCLETVLELHQGGQLPDMVFVFQQAFLSAGTFMITVWHSTNDSIRLAKDEGVLIAATLRSLCRLDARFFSALLRRAQRILCGIAARVLPHLQDEDLSQEMRELIEHNGGVFENGAGFAAGRSDALAMSPSSSMIPKSKPAKSVKSAAAAGSIASLAPKNATDDMVSGSTDASRYKQPQRAEMRDHPVLGPSRSTVDYAPPSDSNSSIARSMMSNDPSSMHAAHDSANGVSASEVKFGTDNTTTSSPMSSLPLPLNDLLPSGAPFGSLGLEMVSDLTWTGYFSRFLGGLLSESPLADVDGNAATGSPHFAYTPGPAAAGYPMGQSQESNHQGGSPLPAQTYPFASSMSQHSNGAGSTPLHAASSPSTSMLANQNPNSWSGPFTPISSLSPAYGRRPSQAYLYAHPSGTNAYSPPPHNHSSHNHSHSQNRY